MDKSINNPTKTVLIFTKTETEIEQISTIIKQNTTSFANSGADGMKEVLYLLKSFAEHKWLCYLTTLDWVDTVNFGIQVKNMENSSIIRLDETALNEQIDLIMVRRLGSVEQQRDKVKSMMEHLDKTYTGVVINPPKTVLYALNKYTYLEYLGAKGFNVPKTFYRNNDVTHEELMAEFPDSENWIVKPTTGECGNSVSVLSKTNPDFFTNKKSKVGGWIVQQKIDDIANGELQLVFTGDHFSHAWRKIYRKAYTPFGVYSQKNEDLKFADYIPTEEELAQSLEILKSLRETGIDIHIGRIDFIKGNPNTILEVEMVNPEIDTDPNRIDSIIQDVINLSESLINDKNNA